MHYSETPIKLEYITKQDIVKKKHTMLSLANNSVITNSETLMMEKALRKVSLFLTVLNTECVFES